MPWSKFLVKNGESFFHLNFLDDYRNNKNLILINKFQFFFLERGGGCVVAYKKAVYIDWVLQKKLYRSWFKSFVFQIETLTHVDIDSHKVVEEV